MLLCRTPCFHDIPWVVNYLIWAFLFLSKQLSHHHNFYNYFLPLYLSSASDTSQASAFHVTCILSHLLRMRITKNEKYEKLYNNICYHHPLIISNGIVVAFWLVADRTPESHLECLLSRISSTLYKIRSLQSTPSKKALSTGSLFERWCLKAQMKALEEIREGVTPIKDV